MIVPNFIILDTRNQIGSLRNALKSLNEFEANINNIILLICDLLVVEVDAEAELYNPYLTGVAEHPFDSVVEDVKNLSMITNSFGKALLDDLQQLKAYRDGILQFKFFKMLGDDIILQREMRDAESLQLLKTRYSDIYNNRLRG